MIYNVVLQVDADKLSKLVNDSDYEIKKITQVSSFLVGRNKKISKKSDELKRRFDKY